MRFDEVQIDRYGPISGIDHDYEDFHVIYGPNESGKTLHLEAMLKLIDPAAADVFDPADRVEEDVIGHVRAEVNGETYTLGNDTTLQDVTDIEPLHLRNIFVIRDNDIRIPEAHSFYDSMTERIGDIHTSEIEAIKDELVNRGRITPANRNLSSAGDNNPKSTRNEAKKLTEDIREYVDEASEEAYDELEAELISHRARLKTVQRQFNAQEAAKHAQDLSRLSNKLDEYREAKETVDELEVFSAETYDELKENASERDRLDGEIKGLQESVEELEDEVESLEGAVDQLESELAPYESRTSDIERLEGQLEEFRDGAHGVPDESVQRLLKLTALSGIVLGGIGAIVGAVVGAGFSAAALLLVLIGVVAFALFYLRHKKVSTVAGRRTELLQSARDLGFEVDEIEDIGPEINNFRKEHERLTKQHNEKDKKLAAKEEALERDQTALEDAREEKEAAEETVQEILDEADVSSVSEFEEECDRRDKAEDARDKARQILEEHLDEPEGNKSFIEYWEKEIANLGTDVDKELAESTEYDEQRHEKLRKELQEHERRIDEIRQELNEHREQIRDFTRDLTDIHAVPYLGGSIELKAETVEGLEQVADDLERLVTMLERDAEVSSKALDIFEELEDEEEKKIADLFEEGGRASEVFRQITDDCYESVTYDAQQQTLEVHLPDGTLLTPRELSRGATEQLYLAARISLAEQLLEGETGFFLLDDAFLPADPERLEHGFDVLESMVDDGWQILYFTAKSEIGEQLAPDRGLPIEGYERLV